MTKEEVLSQFSTKELREEISRRAEIIRAERDKVKRCRSCAYYGTINYWGKTDLPYPSQCCPYKKVKSGKHYKVIQPSEKACEHYKKR